MYVFTPQRHAFFSVLPAGETKFCGHELQAETAIAPTCAEYVPAAQLLQAASPVAPTAPEYFPAPQSLHAAGPGAVLYFPEMHSMHGPPL